MATHMTYDGSPEDMLAFAKFLTWKYPHLHGQHATFITELYPEDLLRWRATRFYWEGFPAAAIAGLTGLDAAAKQAAITQGIGALQHLFDDSMYPFIDQLLRVDAPSMSGGGL